MINNKLDLVLVEIRKEVGNSMGEYDIWLEKWFGNGNIEIKGLFFDVNSYEFKLIREIYELKLEINWLKTWLMEKEKLKNCDLDLLTKMNSLKYVNNLKFDEKVDCLKDHIINTYSSNYSIFIERSNKFSVIESFFYSLGVGDLFNKFDLSVLDNESNFKLLLDKYENNIREVLYDRCGINGIEDFSIPVVRFSDKRKVFDDELLEEIRDGWKRNNLSRNNQILGDKKKNNDGLYLVNFNSLYKKLNVEKYTPSTSLVYSYINYNNKFEYSLVNYIEEVSKFNVKARGINNVVFVIDELFVNSSGWDEEDVNEFIKQNITELGEKNLSLNMIEYLSLMSCCGSMFLNINTIADLIRCLVKREYDKVSNLYFNENIAKEPALHKAFDNKKIHLNLSEQRNINTIFNFVFLVKDLDSLLDKLKDLNVNAGPQSMRGECSFLDANLCHIDESYRKSLYIQNLEYDFGLTGRDFSFKNIHMNLGSVRWYSTSSFVGASKWTYSNQKNNRNGLVRDGNNILSISKWSIRRTSTKIDGTIEKQNYNKVENSNNYKDIDNMYLDIIHLLSNNPINNDTQLKLENILNNTSDSNSSQKLNLFERIGMVNKELKEILMDSCDGITDILNNIKNRKLNELGGDSIKNNEKGMYYLSHVLSVVPNDYIIQHLIGLFLQVLNNPKIEDNYSVKLYGTLGKKIVQNYFYLLKNEVCRTGGNKNYTISDWKRDNIDLVESYDSVIIHDIGGKLSEILIELNLLKHDLVQSSEDYRTNLYVFKINKRLEKFVSLNKIPLNKPERLPMIVKPKPYGKVNDCLKGEKKEVLGGYLLNDIAYSQDIIIRNWKSKINSTIKDDNIIYDTINNLSSVGYKINKEVLNFILANDDVFDLTFINKKHPLEDKKDKLNKYEKSELESFKSKKFVEKNILAIASAFESIPEFFIPVRMDYRGRIYCLPNYLNYQATELARSLLMFSNGEKILKTDIESINYLKIYGANCYGNKLDKKSFKDRIEWVDENEMDIRNFYNFELLKSAESKFQFLGFCFEYNRWLKCLEDGAKSHFTTYLPVQLDATCNGYQHLSMLGMDHNLGSHLNLSESSINDEPSDFYSIISNLTKSYFKQKLSIEGLSDKERSSYKRLINLPIQRQVIKKTIMTIPYNATALTGIQYLKEEFVYDKELNETQNESLNEDKSKRVDEAYDKETILHIELGKIDDKNLSKKRDKVRNKDNVIWFKHKKHDDIKVTSLDFVELYKGMYHVINNEFTSLKNLTVYLKEIAKVCCALRLPIPWLLPSGLYAFQSYSKIKNVRFKPLSYSDSKFLLKIADYNEYDVDKQVRSLMPNLIHSLDASSLTEMLHKYFESYSSKNIYAIHDCFASTANNMEKIINLLKIIYISLYADEGYLRKFNDNIIQSIKNNIGEDFDEENLTVRYYIKDPKDKSIEKYINFPDINKVLDNNYNINLIKESSYLIN